MRCPKCGSPVGWFQILTSKSGIVFCDRCGAELRVFGTRRFIVLPMVAFFFFPFYLFEKGSYWLLPATLVALIFAYYVAYRLFVKLQVNNRDEGPASS